MKLSLILLFGLYLSISGCQFFKSTPSEEIYGEKAENIKDLKNENLIFKLGTVDPVYSKSPREFWIQLRKSNKDPYVKLKAAAAAGDWQVTVKEARYYLKNHPKHKGALKLLATALTMQRSYELALYYTKVFENFYPGDSDIYNLMGICYLYQKSEKNTSFEIAFNMFQKALEKSTSQIAAGMNLGYVYLESGNFYKAADTFATVINRCSSCINAKLGYGISLFRTNQYKESKKILEGILSSNPENGVALYKLALVEKNGFKDYEEAKSHLKTILSSSRIIDKTLKRKANFLLRSIEGMEE